MTVCLAAINEKHKLIAFGADRMVTAASPPIEFEHSMPKFVEITNCCIALSAGDALKGKEIFDSVKQMVGQSNPPISQIVQNIKDIYQQKRLQILEAIYLRARGINHTIFIREGAKILPPAVYHQIDHAFSTYTLPLELLIAGVDASGPSIYGIRNPGLLDCYNPIGFHAIGAGATHALGSLFETYRPSPGPAETMFSVFRAKKFAEIAPGVGEETDLGVAFFDQKLKYFGKNAELFKKFNELYKEEKKARKNLILTSKLVTLEINDVKPSTTESGDDTKKPEKPIKE